MHLMQSLCQSPWSGWHLAKYARGDAEGGPRRAGGVRESQPRECRIRRNKAPFRGVCTRTCLCPATVVLGWRVSGGVTFSLLVDGGVCSAGEFGGGAGGDEV